VTYLSKGENILQCVKRSKVCLTNYIGGNAEGKVVFKHLLTYYFINDMKYHNMVIEYKDPFPFFAGELCMSSFKDRITPS
jgi:hypothetical protein